MELANRVRDARTRLGMRQADLAREVGVSRQTIISIEKGKLRPSIFLALKVARVLREPVDYLFYLEAAEKRPRSRVEPDEIPALDAAAEPAETAEPAAPRAVVSENLIPMRRRDVLDAAPVVALHGAGAESEDLRPAGMWGFD